MVLAPRRLDPLAGAQWLAGLTDIAVHIYPERGTRSSTDQPRLRSSLIWTGWLDRVLASELFRRLSSRLPSVVPYSRLFRTLAPCGTGRKAQDQTRAERAWRGLG